MKYNGRLLSLLFAALGSILGASAAARAVGAISLAVATDTVARCDVGLTNSGIHLLLQHRFLSEANHDPAWEHLDLITIPTSSASQCQYNFTSNFTFNEDDDDDDDDEDDGFHDHTLVQFRLLQWEHGGGYCNCWGIIPGNCIVTTAQHTAQLNHQ